MMNQNIFFQPKDLLKIPDFSNLPKTSMYRKYNQIKDYFDKQNDQKPTFKEVAEFLGIEERTLREAVQSFHKRPA